MLLATFQVSNWTMRALLVLFSSQAVRMNETAHSMEHQRCRTRSDYLLHPCQRQKVSLLRLSMLVDALVLCSICKAIWLYRVQLLYHECSVLPRWSRAGLACNRFRKCRWPWNCPHASWSDALPSDSARLHSFQHDLDPLLQWRRMVALPCVLQCIIYIIII